MSIDVAPPVIGSISALALDALSGAPLAGDAPPYAYLLLAVCIDRDCLRIIYGQDADSDGAEFYWQPIACSINPDFQRFNVSGASSPHRSLFFDFNQYCFCPGSSILTQ